MSSCTSRLTSRSEPTSRTATGSAGAGRDAAAGAQASARPVSRAAASVAFTTQRYGGRRSGPPFGSRIRSRVA